jgi:F1F0 ATPase subunit 2
MLELADPWAGRLLAGAAGLALGAFFFGSLWWTLRRTLSVPPSAVQQLGSLVVRAAITLLGFYAAGAGRADRLLACLAGFVLARLIAQWLAAQWQRRQQRQQAGAITTPRGAGHAPQP